MVIFWTILYCANNPYYYIKNTKGGSPESIEIKRFFVSDKNRLIGFVAKQLLSCIIGHILCDISFVASLASLTTGSEASEATFASVVFLYNLPQPYKLLSNYPGGTF